MRNDHHGDITANHTRADRDTGMVYSSLSGFGGARKMGIRKGDRGIGVRLMWRDGQKCLRDESRCFHIPPVAGQRASPTRAGSPCHGSGDTQAGRGTRRDYDSDVDMLHCWPSGHCGGLSSEGAALQYTTKGDRHLNIDQAAAFATRGRPAGPEYSPQRHGEHGEDKVKKELTTSVALRSVTTSCAAQKALIARTFSVAPLRV